MAKQESWLEAGAVTPPPRPPRRDRWVLTTIMASALAFALTYALLALRASACLAGSANCHRGFHSAYAFDAVLSRHPGWMGELPDETNLTSLSIPGTHDTMTYEIGSRVLECQNANLSTQMEAGVRYFDVRARLRGDELVVYHGGGDTEFAFDEVVLSMCGFLEQNPSEVLVMRLKEEGVPVGRNTLTFEEAFLRYGNSSASRTASCVDEHLYRYDPNDPIPTLGALRSRIFLLQNFKAEQGTYGLAWDGPQMQLEDFWILPDLSFLADKWEAIRRAVTLANEEALDNEKLYLAHVSASVGVLPIEAAAGPRDGRVKGMNEMTGSWLEENADHAHRAGVVIFDFPGAKAIDAVLRWNHGLKGV